MTATLRELAQAALDAAQGEPTSEEDRPFAWIDWSTKKDDTLDELHDACSPDAILALLTKLDAAQEALRLARPVLADLCDEANSSDDDGDCRFCGDSWDPIDHEPSDCLLSFARDAALARREEP